MKSSTGLYSEENEAVEGRKTAGELLTVELVVTVWSITADGTWKHKHTELELEKNTHLKTIFQSLMM